MRTMRTEQRDEDDDALTYPFDSAERTGDLAARLQTKLHDCRAALAATEMRAIESEKDAAAFLRSRDEAVARADEAERAVVRLWEYCDIHIDAEDYFSELAPLVARIRERAK